MLDNWDNIFLIRKVLDIEFRLSKSINKFFWTLYPIIFLFNSINNIYNTWELQLQSINELEDFGLLLYVLAISACESALIVIFIYWIKNLLVRASGKPKA